MKKNQALLINVNITKSNWNYLKLKICVIDNIYIHKLI